jgi:hypothetical protein
MVIDMGVHQLSGLPQKVNLVQVGWQNVKQLTVMCYNK